MDSEFFDKITPTFVAMHPDTILVDKVKYAIGIGLAGTDQVPIVVVDIKGTVNETREEKKLHLIFDITVVEALRAFFNTAVQEVISTYDTQSDGN